MAIVLIRFDGGAVPIVVGDIPPNADTPVSDPLLTGFVTNQAFMVDEGVYCFALDMAPTYRPLWQVVQAIDGQPAEITFRRAQDQGARYGDIPPTTPWPRRK